MELFNSIGFVVFTVFVAAFLGTFYVVPKLLYFWGVRMVKKGDFAGAVRYFERASGISPKDANLWLGRGVSLRRARRLNEALEALEQVERLEPSQTVALKERVAVLREQGRGDEALRELTLRLEKDPEADELRLLRTALEIEARFLLEAEKDCDYLVANGSESFLAEALNNRGAARLLSGREDDAEIDFETSYLINPRLEVVRAFQSNSRLCREVVRKRSTGLSGDKEMEKLVLIFYARGSARPVLVDKDVANSFSC